MDVPTYPLHPEEHGPGQDGGEEDAGQQPMDAPTHPLHPGHDGRHEEDSRERPMDVPIHLLHDAAQPPRYATPGSHGFDLCTAEAAEIAPGEIVLVGTGLVLATPPGWCLLVCLRSSTPRKFGVIQPHAVGVIDEDYRGPADELRLQLLNFTASPTTIPAGSRIAQGVFVRAGRAQWGVHDPEERSRGGFGSTGG